MLRLESIVVKLPVISISFFNSTVTLHSLSDKGFNKE